MKFQQEKKSVFDYLKGLRNRDIFLHLENSDESTDEDYQSAKETNFGNESSGKSISNEGNDYFRTSSYDYFRNFNGSQKLSFDSSCRLSFNTKSFFECQKKSHDSINKKLISYRTKANYCASDFEFLDVLGSGAYAEVVKARHKKTLEIFAIKIIDKIEIEREKKLFQIYIENEFLNSLDHPNIIKIFGAFEEKEKIYLVLEFVPYGTLGSYIKKFGKYICGF